MTGPIDLYLFDLYGTLLDYGALRDTFASLAPRPDAFVADWRQKQIQYSFAATLMGRYVDFDELTGRAFDYACALHGVVPDAAQRALAVDVWSALPPFPDALAALGALRARGARCAVLSNGTPRAIAAAVAGAGIDRFFDATLSVDDVKTYKPHPSVYESAVRRFATVPERVIFVSSNGWDATGAAEFGFRVVWCNRANLPAERFGRPPERIVRSLTEVVNE